MKKIARFKVPTAIISVFLLNLSIQSISALSWTDEYTLNDLQLNEDDFVNQEVPYWNISSCYSGSCVKYYNCAGTYLLGGYKVLGGTKNQYFERVYTDLPEHNQINIQMTFYPLDSWDGPDVDDHFDLTFDGTSYYAWKLDGFSDTAFKLCGDPDYKDTPIIRATISIPHSGTTLTFRVVNQLDEKSDNESIGFRDIIMKFVNMTTPAYSLCGVVTAGTLPNQICPCQATNMYMDPVNSGYCHECNSLCATCNGPLETHCTSCYDGKYVSSGTCNPCESSCATCNGPLSSNCLGCPSTTYLVDTTCTPYCPEPFHSTQSSGSNVCQTDCPGQFAYKNGTCSSDCVSPYGPFYTVSLKACICYSPGQDICYTCDSSCATCKGQEATQCATCPDRFYVSIIDTTENTGTCEACDPSCLTCSGSDPDQCLTCDPYYYLVTDNSVEGTCQSCAGTCLTCNGPLANQCLTCADGFYLTASGTCSSCNTSCKSCNGPSSDQCLTCATGSFLVNNNTCVTSCNLPFYSTSNGIQNFCESPCKTPQSPYALGSSDCQASCGTGFRSEVVSTLKACYCDGYIYWNSSCLATCNLPLTNNRTQDIRKYCDYPCTSNEEYLYPNGTCSVICDFPLIRENIADKAYCNSKGCASMEVKYVKALTRGYEYKLNFIPASCDFEPLLIQTELNKNAQAKQILGDFSFTVSRIQGNSYLLDLELSQSILEDTNLNLTLGNLTANMLVFQKFRPSELAEKLKELAASAQSAVTAATGATLVSTLVMQGTTSVWGFVGFQQLINYLKYIAIQYPFQMEMLFVLGGGTKFSSYLPNVIESATQTAFEKFSSNETLVDEQEPPRKFSDYDETSFYIKNGGSIILVNLVILVITALLALLGRSKKVKEHKIFGKIFTAIDGNLRWNFLIRTFLTTSIPLGVAICLQFRTLTFQDYYLTVSGLLTIASTIYFVAICGVMLRILCARDPEEFKKKECIELYGTLVKGLDIKNGYSKYYYMLTLVRGVMISVVIVFAQTQPLLQILCLLFTNVGILAYTYRYVVFINPKETRKTLITEFFVTVAEILIALLTAKKKSEEYYDTIGWVIVGVVGLMFINELVFIISMQVTAIREAIKVILSKLKKKKPDTVKTDESFVELALPSPTNGEIPTSPMRKGSFSIDQTDNFTDLDQEAPEHIKHVKSSKSIKNICSHFSTEQNLKLPWSALGSRRQTFTNSVISPMSPLSGDNPVENPVLFEDLSSIITEEPADVQVDEEVSSPMHLMVDRKTAQKPNPDFSFSAIKK